MKIAKSNIVTTIKVILAIILFSYIFFFYLDYNKLSSSISEVNYLLFLSIVPLGFLIRILNAYQTKILLEPFGIKYSSYHIFKVNHIAMFYSMFLPGDLAGGAVTWHYLSRDSGMRAQVATVIVLVRVINLISLIPFAVLGFYYEPRIVQLGYQNYIILFGILSFSMIIPFFSTTTAYFFENLFFIFIKLFPYRKIRPRLVEANTNFWNSVRFCKSFPKQIVSNFIFGISMIFIANITTLVSFISVGVNLSLFIYFWVNSFNAIVLYLPINLFGIGGVALSAVLIYNNFYDVTTDKIILALTISYIFNLIFPLLGAYYNATLKSKKETNDK